MTNGPTWAEYLSKLLGSDLYNFAFSGATANNSVVYRTTADVSEQIYMFQQTLRNQKLDPQESIYMLWTGVNDVHDIFVASKDKGIEPESAIDRVISSVYNELERLFTFSNACNFGIMGLAPIDRLPLFDDLSSDEKSDLRDLIKLYNYNMQNMIKQFIHDHTSAKRRKRQYAASNTGQVKIYFFDSHNLFQTFFEKPDEQDLWVLDKMCQSENSTQCRVPDRYLWWDTWHPTTAAHKIIANGVSDLITL
ncbi:GDSL lipase/esterase [Phycomyces blakesleeanus]|uniref:GDSL lipase/esterase n=1 Tax=Phycomyces blakesleeanus TaxID=4837 RepID=A0ABR3B040_PHYBL